MSDIRGQILKIYISFLVNLRLHSTTHFSISPSQSWSIWTERERERDTGLTLPRQRSPLPLELYGLQPKFSVKRKSHPFSLALNSPLLITPQLLPQQPLFYRGFAIRYPTNPPIVKGCVFPIPKYKFHFLKASGFGFGLAALVRFPLRAIPASMDELEDQQLETKLGIGIST